MAERYPDISDENFTSRMLYQLIRTKFPSVKQISTDKLDEWLSDNEMQSKILIIDVREKEEQQISSIKSAFQIIPNSDTKELLSKIQSSEVTKVIVFCSVGYRSCSLVKILYSEMKKMNILGVDLYNLEGSLFKWANENKTIVDTEGKETMYVHPYNTVWGKFLEVDRRKYSWL